MPLANRLRERPARGKVAFHQHPDSSTGPVSRNPSKGNCWRITPHRRPTNQGLATGAAGNIFGFRMGLFSKARKPAPKITVEGVEITFQCDCEGWSFSWRGTEFRVFEARLAWPGKAKLEALLEVLEALKAELRERLKKGLAEWGGARLDDGETFFVDVKDYAADQTFTASWSDGASWGDLGVDFTIKGGAIIDEAWGD
jgi:hypothetical protein